MPEQREGIAPDGVRGSLVDSLIFCVFVCMQNSTTMIHAAAAAMIILAAAVNPLTIPYILWYLGFSPMGPVAGSFAAWWQSQYGSVAAGSLFAILQAWAMGGGIL